MNHSNTYVAIMAGGVGSRFWPASRTSRPKQFLDIMNEGHSLLVTTFNRFASYIPAENIYIVTNEIYKEQVKEQLPILADDQILCEPSRRNTAPCIAYVSYKIAEKNPQANIVVVPSDHLISNPQNFKEVIEKGLNYVNSLDCLLTLGIKPSRPDTNYGYVQYLEEDVNSGIFKVKTFTEKPTLEIAKQFLDSGDFLWNSGIFLWSVQSIIKAIRLYLPELAESFEEDTSALVDEREKEYISKVYSQCKNVSIDYGVMEKAYNVFVIPSDFGWSDLGTWNSLWDNMEKDENGNAISGKKVMVYDSKNNMVSIPSDKLSVIQGVENLCIVDTEDVLLICTMDDEKKLKDFLLNVKNKFGDTHV